MDGGELDVFPWLRFFKTRNYVRLIEVKETKDELVNQLVEEGKVDWREI